MIETPPMLIDASLTGYLNGYSFRHHTAAPVKIAVAFSGDLDGRRKRQADIAREDLAFGEFAGREFPSRNLPAVRLQVHPVGMVDEVVALVLTVTLITIVSPFFAASGASRTTPVLSANPGRRSWPS